MLSFSEYRADYKSKLLKGKKFILSDFNRSWNDYKKSQVEISTVKDPVIVSDPLPNKMLQPVITIEPQSDSVIQSTAVFVDPIKPIDPKPTDKALVDPKVSQDAYFDISELEEIADALHQTIANIAEFVSNGKVKIDQGAIKRLNRFGSKLLKKYDRNGFLEKYALEIAYGVTVLSVGMDIIVSLQLSKAESVADSKQTTVNSDNNLIAMMEQLKEQHAREIRDLKNIIAKQAENIQ